MKYLICLIPLLFLACATSPNRVRLCEEGILDLYRRHNRIPDRGSIHDACMDQVRKEMRDERNMNRR